MNNILRRCHLLCSSSRQWYPVGINSLPVPASSLQIVRWRKMRLYPISKRKEFKVFEPKPLAPGEWEELTRLQDKYDADALSLTTYLQSLYNEQNEKLYYDQVEDHSDAALQAAEAVERQHREMMEYNTQENERLAKLREERVGRELDERMEHIVITKMKWAVREEKQRQEALQVLAETEEFVKTFIPPEDISRALEHAYDNPVDYNYAIDRQGFMYPGLATKPEDISPDDRPSLADPLQPRTGPVDTRAVRRTVATAAN